MVSQPDLSGRHPGAHERLAGDVLGPGPVAGQVEGEAEHVRPVALVDAGEIQRIAWVPMNATRSLAGRYKEDGGPAIRSATVAPRCGFRRVVERHHQQVVSSADCTIPR